MSQSDRALEAELRELLSSQDAVASGGLRLDDLAAALKVSKEKLRGTMRDFVKRDIVTAIPDKKHGQWYMKYYIPPSGQTPVSERLESIMTELGIPPWLDVKIFRGWKVLFVGSYGKKPGLRIIDYGKDPPLVFRDKHAGGEASEIIHFAKRSKYKCTKYGKVFWYNYHGRPFT